MPATTNANMSLGEWGMLIGLSILWGGSFFFAEVAVAELPPLTIVAIRVGLAAIILNIALRAVGVPLPRDARVWAAFAGMGLLNNAIPFSLIVWGQTYISSGLASVLNATTPLWVVLVAHFVTSGERMTTNKLMGVLIGIAGVAVIAGPEAVAGLGSNVVAQLAVLAAAIFYALAGIFGRRFKRMGVPPIVTATGQVTTSTMLLLPLALLVDQPWRLASPSADVLAALVGLAALSTAFAYVLYFRILATAGATNLLLVTFLIPVSAIILGVTILGEVLAPSHFLGMTLIALGLAAIDGRLIRMLKRRVRAVGAAR
jgi:drug/metabolite transporter (DMT)-like permease